MKKLLLFICLLGLVGGLIAYKYYSDIFSPNISIEHDKELITIPLNASWEEVVTLITPFVEDMDAIEKVKSLKNFDGKVLAGKYMLEDGMNSNDLVNMFRAGNQFPVNLVILSTRTFEELAGMISRQMMTDSVSMLNMFKNDSIIDHYGFNKHNFASMFIPNTYEIYWTKQPEEIIQRMANEFKKFWNDNRLQKANALNLSQSEVATIASIVQEEQLGHPEEWPTIAGLYLNRIRLGMALESDPTIKFALGNFNAKRILNKDKKSTKDHPFNTYYHPGIPPGPIRFPDPEAIDAVLNAEKHNYIFMCAKSDFSGLHHFSKTLREHNRHARSYQKELDRQNIYR